MGRSLPKNRVAIRGYVREEQIRRCIFEEELTVDDDELGDLLPDLAKRHGAIIVAHPLHMIEFELLDEPLGERFLRFGTDPSMMVLPLLVKLEGE